MLNINQILTVTFTLFAVIDMLGNIPIMISIKEKIGEIEALKATAVSGFLMFLFLFIGESFLKILGVDLNSFAIGGAILIFILGLELSLGIELFKSEEGREAGSIIPIAFPLIAGSGTLTTLMSLKTQYSYEVISAGIVLNLLVIYLVIRLLVPLEKMLGRGGLLLVRKFMGVILLAVAIKIFKLNWNL
jgi:multiple antibiotic resistance protein